MFRYIIILIGNIYCLAHLKTKLSVTINLAMHKQRTCIFICLRLLTVYLLAQVGSVPFQEPSDWQVRCLPPDVIANPL